jgi:hypothetical protein
METKDNHFNSDSFNDFNLRQLLRSILNDNDHDDPSSVDDTYKNTKKDRYRTIIDNKETPFEAYKCVHDCVKDDYPVKCVQMCPY